MGKKFKKKVQCLIFNKNVFNNRRMVKKWIEENSFIVDKRLKKPILDCGCTFRARQKNPDWFNKKTFKCEKLDKGVKGVYGLMKR